MLFELIADLSREARAGHRDVTDRFAADPEGTFARYGVGPGALACLERGDDDGLVSLMSTELRAALASVRGPTPMYWGRPSFRVTAVALRSPALAGQDLDVSVAGDDFPDGAAVQFQKDALVVTAESATRVAPGEIAARVRLPEPGTYNVVVAGERERYGFLPAAVTVGPAA